MSKYHKINAPYKRDMQAKKRDLIPGDWAVPEFEFLQDVLWVAKEKLDGTNIRVIFDPENKTVEFKGRTDNAQIPKHLLSKLEDIFTVETLSNAFPKAEGIINPQVVLYGEGVGHKIQKMDGKYFAKGEVGFVLFDVKIGRWYLTDDAVFDISNKLSIDSTPTVATLCLDDLFDLVKDGLKSKYGDFFAEGVVAKPQLQLFARNGDRIITKIKHKDFYIDTK